VKKREWIAVMERGECSFSQKIRLATKLGALGAVIIDTHPRALSPIIMNTMGKSYF